MSHAADAKELNLKEIGDTIKSIRQKKGLKLRELSERTGLSNGFLSQIEHGQAQTSVGNLWKISQALEVPLGTFFAELDKDPINIVRKDERKHLSLPKSNRSYRLLSPDLNRKIEMILIILEPGITSEQRETVVHEGEECGYVISGQLGIIHGDKEYYLQEGDSAYLDCTLPHRFFNPGPDQSVSVWAMTPPSF